MKRPQVCIVVAIGKNRELGLDGKLLWHIPDDLKRFKTLTKGHPIILGRKTFESIVGYIGGPLPDRQNIVVTRDATWAYPGVLNASTIDEAFEMAESLHPAEIHIGGGAQIYEQVLPRVDKLFLTIVDDEKPADSFFPAYENDFTHVTHEESHEWSGLKYRWVDLERSGQ
jgi:dihydrofolate reductase